MWLPRERAESPRDPSGTSPYQLAHAPLGCQAICTLMVNAHLTGSTAQSMLSMRPCQAHRRRWLDAACPSLRSSLKGSNTSRQVYSSLRIYFMIYENAQKCKIIYVFPQPTFSIRYSLFVIAYMFMILANLGHPYFLCLNPS